MNFVGTAAHLTLIPQVPGGLVTNRMTLDTNTLVLALWAAILDPLQSIMLTAPTVFNPYMNTLLPEYAELPPSSMPKI
jgi:hypothetical protein